MNEREQFEAWCTAEALCLSAVDHVGLANYAERVAEAKMGVRKAFAALQAALAASPVPAGWLPIETAPKNGTAFRGYHESLIDLDFNPQGSVECAFDGEQFIGCVWNGQQDAWYGKPVQLSHWMPLPAAPTESAAPAQRAEAKALEFAEYMAKGAEQYIDAVNKRDELVHEMDERGDPNDDDAASELFRLNQLADDCMRGLRAEIYEFRKRAAKVPAIATAPSVEVEAQAAKLHRAFAEGWRVAAHWAKRPDLLADMGSPAYLEVRAAALKESQR